VARVRSPPRQSSTPETSYLVIDLETVPDLEIWHPPTPGAFPPPHACKIVAIGCLWLGRPRGAEHGDDRLMVNRLGMIAPKARGGDERLLIETLSAFLLQHRPIVVTFNGAAFDMRVLRMRAFRHGIAHPVIAMHHDVMAKFDAGPIGLDIAARMIGLPGKLGIDGSQVEAYVNSDQIEIVHTHCLSDVVQTACVYLRHRVSLRTLSPDAFRGTVENLLRYLEKDQTLGHVVTAIDRPRLLLQAHVEGGREAFE
jgi:hypothetical protein